MDESNPNEPSTVAEPEASTTEESSLLDEDLASDDGRSPESPTHSGQMLIASSASDDEASAAVSAPISEAPEAAAVTPTRRTVAKPSGLKEFFLLSSAEDAEAGLGSQSADFRRTFQRAERRAEAAVSLWNAGIYPEAYGLLASACESLREIGEQHPSLIPLMGSLDSLQMSASPESLEDEVRPDVQRQFDERREQVTTIVGALRSVSLGKSKRNWIRTQRLVVSMLFALALGSGIGKFINRVTLTATAPVSYNLIQYPPKHVADADYSTNWLLTDGTAGWVEVAFRKRNVNAVRLFNVRGLVRYGAADSNVEFYLNGRVVRTIPVNMRPTVNTLEPARVPFTGRIQADKIRVNIQTYHDLGGGLAEIEVE